MKSTWQKAERFWTASIRRQLMLGMILVHAVLMTIFVFDLVHRQQSFLADQGVSQTRSLAETLAANSTSWVLARDVLGLEEVVASQSKYPGLLYAMVVAPDGRVLGHSDRKFVGKFLQDETSLSLLNAEHAPQVLTRNNRLIDVAAPVLANGQYIAWARVAISRDDVARSLQIVTRDGILYTVAAIAIGMLFAFFMAGGMTRSLQHMVSVADSRRKGGSDRIEIDRADELGRLGHAFNELADAVDRREAELRHHQDHLEEQVERRTQDLSKEIAERKQIETELRESRAAIAQNEQRLLRILDSSLAGISVVQQNPLKRLYANQRFFQMFGIDPETPLKTLDFDVTYTNDGDAQRVLGNIRKGQGFENYVMERKRLGGETWWAWMDGVPIEFEGKPAVIVWHFDVTDQKRAEADLIQSEKMASLGGLVAGVAHEINTPLGTSVTASTHLTEITGQLRADFTDGKLSRSRLERALSDIDEGTTIISKNLNRAADLVRSFKQVSADQSSDSRRAFDLATYLDEIALSLKPRITQSGHALTVECVEGIAVDSYPGSLSQVVTNIVMNALTHAFDEAQDGNITISGRQDGNNGVLVISDDGHGMNAGTCQKIFEPFFTTARGHGGTGLGLHIVYNQITQVLGGTIECQTEEGSGTTFTIRFPLVAKERAPAA